MGGVASADGWPPGHDEATSYQHRHGDRHHRRHHRDRHQVDQVQQGSLSGGTATVGATNTGTPPASAPDPALPASPLTPPTFQAQVQAFADTTIPGSDTTLTWHFSELVPNAIQFADLGGTDCRLYLGIVRDPGPTGGVDAEPVSMLNYRVFSGTTINCATPANLISAGSVVQYCTAFTAAECTSSSGNWFSLTEPHTATLLNTFGSGDTLLVSPGICRGNIQFIRAAALNVTVDNLTYGPIVGAEHQVNGGCIDANTPSPPPPT